MSTKCQNMSHLKKYAKRPSPPYPANECPNQIRIGNDGNEYVSKPDKRGIFAWKKVPLNKSFGACPREKKPKKKMKKSRKRSPKRSPKLRYFTWEQLKKMKGPFTLMQSPDTTGNGSGECEIYEFSGVIRYDENTAELEVKSGSWDPGDVFYVWNYEGYVVSTNAAYQFILNPTKKQIEACIELHLTIINPSEIAKLMRNAK